MPRVICKRLANNVLIPAVQLGTYRLTRDDEKAVITAFETGYRALDCARFYENENIIGPWVADYKGPFGSVSSQFIPDGMVAVPDDEFLANFSEPHGPTSDDRHVFVATKVWPTMLGDEAAIRQLVDDHLKNFKRSSVDLLMMHWPGCHRNLPGGSLEVERSGENSEKRKLTWQIFEKLYGEKKVRALGVSNFTARHMMELLDFIGKRKYNSLNPIPLMYNQVEGSPWITGWHEIQNICDKNNIAIAVYRPLGGDREKYGRLSENSALDKLADKLKTPKANLICRWLLEQGLIVLPKSSNPGRVSSNIHLFSFELTNENSKVFEDLRERDAHELCDPHDIA